MTQEKTHKNVDKTNPRFFRGWWKRNGVIVGAVLVMLFMLYGGLLWILLGM